MLALAPVQFVKHFPWHLWHLIKSLDRMMFSTVTNNMNGAATPVVEANRQRVRQQHHQRMRLTEHPAKYMLPWGSMQVQTPPRVRQVAGYIGRGKIASEEGTLPRNLFRHLVDGRVFQRVRRKRGGTVLIDCSGSMSLETSDLKRILEHSPGACVAVYSGNDRDGVLRILAAGGRQVDDQWIAAPAGGANVVDGPALQWLSKQQKPRIWVSDGQVTGIHDRMSAINSLECMDVCRRHRVVRHPNMNEAVAALSKLNQW